MSTTTQSALATSGATPPASEGALLALLERLSARGYRFVTPLNSTVRLIRNRKGDQAADLRDALGWSLPFQRGALDLEIEALLDQAGCLAPCEQGFQSTIRVSALPEGLFLHSAYPARGAEAVFLGPDSYRFAEFLRRELAAQRAMPRILDLGCGAGVGGIVAAKATMAGRVVFADCNPAAVRLAGINAAHAGVHAEGVVARGFEKLDGDYDLIVANPPFIAETGRVYSDGGALHGLQLSLDWATEAAGHLRPGGRLLMYTGSAIVAGEDRFRQAIWKLASQTGRRLDYRELDPDIFGCELSRTAYAEVERIAAVGLSLSAP